MAWILHEPRLVAEVPVFCLVGLRPLIVNNRLPVSISVASIELLYHLHLRLEVTSACIVHLFNTSHFLLLSFMQVLSKDEPDQETDDLSETSSVLWEVSVGGHGAMKTANLHLRLYRIAGFPF